MSVLIVCALKLCTAFLQIQTIVGKYGIVVISRFGHNAEEFVYKSDELFPLKVRMHNIIIVCA